jgi:twinkle protein
VTSNFVKHSACDKCGSSDGKAVYSDGHSYCFICHDKQNYVEDEELPDNENLDHTKQVKEIKPLAEEFGSWKDRGFTPKTVAKYQVTVGGKGNKFEAVYPFFDKDGAHVSNKIRFPGKEFIVQGDFKSATLFGQQAFPAGSAKQITITEGQDDAMAVFEMQGQQYPAVSIASASSVKRDIANNFEYLNSFGEIVLCFDNDEPGKAAAQVAAGMFKPGKVRLMNLTDGKDANEYLLAGKTREFGKQWWAAAPFTPTGLKLGSQMWDDIKEAKKYETVSYPYKGLNYATYGIRLSEVVLVTAHTKVGKTTLLKEITSHLLANAKKEYGVGGLFLEESNADTALGLMSIEANKPLHLPDVREGVTQEELKKLFDASVNTDRLVLWDHFGSNTIEGVLDKIRHMHALGCKYIILDHLSIIVSDQNGDERKQLDEISTKLKMLCMELNIAVIAVIHQSRSGVVRGSAGPEQIANITVKLTRDLEDEDEWRRNVTKVTVTLNRFCGRTGPAGYLLYDPVTGRQNELTPEEGKKYEQSAPDSNAKGEKWS